MGIFELALRKFGEPEASVISPSDPTTESTEPVTPKAFHQMFDAITEELAERYQEGTRDYTRANHRALLAELQSVDDRMVTAWRDLDFSTFEETLRRWEQIHREMIHSFEEHQNVYT
jgi:hypothetical protein